MWTGWALDASISHEEDGLYCFCPMEGDDIIYGVIMIDPEPPGKLVCVIHPDGDDAAAKWADDHKELLDGWKEAQGRSPCAENSAAIDAMVYSHADGGK